MLYNIYKPKTWTSFDIVAKLRGILKTKKIGHAGTLDPLAEGVLVVLTQGDTKRQDDFLKLSKEYIAEFGFGIKSPTYDLEFTPEVVKEISSSDSASASSILQKSFEEVTSCIKSFIGTFEQTAPAYSAKKVGGKVLYKEARKGHDVSKILPKKTVTIFNIDVLEVSKRQLETTLGNVEIIYAKCCIQCSSGTYIRSLAHDIGVKLGSDGVMLSLVRTKVGEFNIKDSVTLEDIAKSQGQ